MSKSATFNPKVKNNRCGQAGIFTPEQFEELLLHSAPKYRLLWGICYYTSCRISEALQLERSDFISDRIIFRAKTTKDKKTRDVKVSSKLGAIVSEVGLPEKGFLFPGVRGKPMTRQAADTTLREICDYLGFHGMSTHSFRRTSITNLHDAGVPLKHIQKRSGHATLANLARYVEVNQEAVDAAGELL